MYEVTPRFPRRIAIRLGLAGLLALGVAAAFTAVGPRSARADGPPAIQITPNTGPFSTETVVTGQGFGPDEQVAIYREERPFFAYDTDEAGQFTGVPHPLIGPGPVSGVITITGIGRTSGLKATTTFTVTP